MNYILIIIFIIFLCWSETHAICVHTQKAEIKAIPSEKAIVVGHLNKYTPLELQQINGPWLLTKDSAGFQTWLHRSHVTKIYKCTALKAKRTYLLSGPGWYYTKKRRKLFKRGNSFKVLKNSGKWYLLESFNGEIGWLHKIKLYSIN